MCMIGYESSKFFKKSSYQYVMVFPHISELGRKDLTQMGFRCQIWVLEEMKRGLILQLIVHFKVFALIKRYFPHLLQQHIHKSSRCLNKIGWSVRPSSTHSSRLCPCQSDAKREREKVRPVSGSVAIQGHTFSGSSSILGRVHGLHIPSPW